MLCVSLSDFESPYKGGWGGGEDNRNEEKKRESSKGGKSHDSGMDGKGGERDFGGKRTVRSGVWREGESVNFCRLRDLLGDVGTEW